MQTQRDHVHAHQFMMGRLGSALVQGDPTSAEIPGRRAMTGLLFGILVAALGIGGVAVYGWIVPGGSTAYSKPGNLVVEKETGNRYVYLDGALRPVANVTTASLLLGKAMTVKLISRNSIKDVPRGAELGDSGWPQSVSGGTRVAGPWLVCLPGSLVEKPDPAALGVNLDPQAPVAVLPQDRFSVVRSPAGLEYLIIRGHKFRIEADSVLVALGASNVRPMLAPQTWLDWLPDGVALGPAKVPGAGTVGSKVGGQHRRVGTLFRQRPAGGEEQLFVLRKDGLAPISATEFLLGAAAAATPPVELDAAAVVSAARSSDRTLLDRLPDLTAMRPQDRGSAALCQRQRPSGEDTFETQIVFTAAGASGVDATGRAGVLAAPGTGMAVVAVPHPQNQRDQVVYLSESGTAYPVADTDSQNALGLDGTPVPFPQSLLAALPHGPALSRGAIYSPAGG